MHLFNRKILQLIGGSDLRQRVADVRLGRLANWENFQLQAEYLRLAKCGFPQAIDQLSGGRDVGRAFSLSYCVPPVCRL